jgi:hypothetical protein
MTNSNLDALSESHKSKAVATDRLASAADALAKANRMQADASARVDKLEQAHTATELAHGETLAAAIVNGRATATLPPAAPDTAHAATLQAARHHSTITANAVRSLHTAHARADDEYKATEAAVRDATYAVVDSEAAELAAQIIDLEKQAVSLRERLFGLAETFDGPNTPPSERRGLAMGAIQALNGPGLFDPPRYAEGMRLLHGPHKARIESARLEWIERIAQLKAGAPRGECVEPPQKQR